ncbi:hypothetical protein QQF64_021542 [Cirrhinus molitorella]|uniref:Uncharacterized protein n=1 Tax=Cirrhinus molitorella TaxID=172907 RepID=A0ABR3L5M1_9TELE
MLAHNQDFLKSVRSHQLVPTSIPDLSNIAVFSVTCPSFHTLEEHEMTLSELEVQCFSRHILSKSRSLSPLKIRSAACR